MDPCWEKQDKVDTQAGGGNSKWSWPLTQMLSLDGAMRYEVVTKYLILLSNFLVHWCFEKPWFYCIQKGFNYLLELKIRKLSISSSKDFTKIICISKSNNAWLWKNNNVSSIILAFISTFEGILPCLILFIYKNLV